MANLQKKVLEDLKGMKKCQNETKDLQGEIVDELAAMQAHVYRKLKLLWDVTNEIADKQVEDGPVQVEQGQEDQELEDQELEDMEDESMERTSCKRCAYPRSNTSIRCPNCRFL